MARETAISWAEATWNVLTGCTVLSPGCQRCYAMKLAGGRLKNHWSRLGLTVDTKTGPVWTGEVRFNEAWLDDPIRWRRPTVIFVCAHSDLFHDSVPDEVLDRIFAVMARRPDHLFLVLTKRMARARRYIGDTEFRVAATASRVWAQVPGEGMPKALAGHGAARGDAAPWPLRNVYLGTSIEDQAAAELRLPDLVETPAALHWVSAEPLLEPLDLAQWLFDPVKVEDMPGAVVNPGPGPIFVKPSGKIGWLVAGGESQSGARWLPSQTARGLRDQCAAAGVPFHFKQWGAWLPRDQIVTREQQSARATAPEIKWEEGAAAYRVGPKLAGHLLDGVEHRAMPWSTTERATDAGV